MRPIILNPLRDLQTNFISQISLYDIILNISKYVILSTEFQFTTPSPQGDPWVRACLLQAGDAIYSANHFQLANQIAVREFSCREI